MIRATALQPAEQLLGPAYWDEAPDRPALTLSWHGLVARMVVQPEAVYSVLSRTLTFHPVHAARTGYWRPAHCLWLGRRLAPGGYDRPGEPALMVRPARVEDDPLWRIGSFIRGIHGQRRRAGGQLHVRVDLVDWRAEGAAQLACWPGEIPLWCLHVTTPSGPRGWFGRRSGGQLRWTTYDLLREHFHDA